MRQLSYKYYLAISTSFLAAGICHAQSVNSAASLAGSPSSVTIYGIISEGIAAVSNAGGHSQVEMFSSALQSTRWGFRIVEDLGGGNRAIAVLENGFDLNSGKLQNGGRLFGRQSFVGLGNDSLGALTFGRQYDMFYDFMDLYELPVGANNIGAHIGDNDNAFGTFRYNNSVKYVSPTIAGLQFEMLYGMSNAAGNFHDNSAFSAGMGYRHGSLTLTAAYLELHRPGTAVNSSGTVTDDYTGAPFQLFHTSPLNSSVGVDTQRQYGFAASYAWTRLQLNSEITSVRYTYLDGTSLQLTNLDLNGTYRLTPTLVLGGGYVLTHGTYHGAPGAPTWHMGSVSLDYLLSKRTDLYVYDVYQLASHGFKADIFGFTPSSSRTQNVLMAGIRHKF
jgi:predicted porin